jgi:autotransporter-associated beta strand protein
MPPFAQASTVFLDTTSGIAGLGGGTTNWDAGTTAVWTLDPTGAALTTTYTSGSDVIFNTSALGTITVNGTVAADSLTFQSNVAETISGGSTPLITLGGGATPVIAVLGGDNAANTISAAINLAAATSAFTLSNAGTGTLTVGQITGTAAANQTLNASVINSGILTLNGVIADGTGGGTVGLVVYDPLSTTTTGITNLSGNNTFTGGVLVKAGGLYAGTAAGGSAFGNSTVTLGDTSADALPVTLNFGGTQGTYANNIALNSGTTGAITLSSANASTNVVLSGTITGTNNFTINESGAAAWTLSNTVNNIGTVTNSGTGAGGISLTGGVGPNVTAVIENSTTSALTIGGLGLTVNSAGTTLVNAKGTATLTVTGNIGGSGNLILQNSSTTANGISISGAVNNTGNVVFSGATTASATLSGGVSISGNIGSNVQNLANTSQGIITLSGTDSYTGTTTISTGAISVNGTGGALTATTAVTVDGGGVFNIGDQTNGVANRINTAATLTLGDSTGGGSLVLFRGNAGNANSQSFASLAVGGAATIAYGGLTTGVAPALTFSGALPYTRTVGGLLNITNTNLGTISFTNAPSGAGNVSNNILVGAVLNSNDLIKAQAGTVTAAAYTPATSTTWGGATVDTSIAVANTASAQSANSLVFAGTTLGAATTTLSGANVITSGGILVQTAAAGGAAIAQGTSGTLMTGTAGGDLWVYLNGRALSIAVPIIDNGTSGLTVGGGSTLTLSGINTYAGLTTVQGGSLALSSSGIAVPGNLTLTGAPGSTAGATVTLNGSNEIAGSSVVSMGGNAGNNLILNNFSQTLAGLQTLVSGIGTTGSTENLVENNSATAGTSTLTLNNAANYTFDGLFRNGSTGALAFTKQGIGKFTLQNTHGDAATSYTGATTISGGTLALSDNGNGDTVGTFASAITDNATLELDNTSLATAETLGVVVGGSGGVNINAGTAAIVLKGANTFQGNVNVNTGTLRVTTSGTALGAGTNTVTVANGAALDVNVVLTNTNALTISGAGTNGFGALTDSAVVGTYAGAVTLSGAATIGTSSTFALSVTGAVGGTGNLTLNANSTGAITLGTVNNTGTVTNAGYGAALTTIGTLGALVTGVVQSGNSPLTITNGITPSATYNNIASTGAGLFTIGSIGAATQPLTFNANSSGGITVTGATGSTGTITNSGTGTGSVIFTGAIGATITNVTENSPTSSLVLSSATNAYTGTTTVTQGILSFAGTPTITTGASGLGGSTSNIILGGASTMGLISYTGASATMARGVTVNAGGGEIDATTGTLTILPASGTVISSTGPVTFGGANNVTVGSTTYASTLITGATAINKTGAGTASLSTLINTAGIANAATPINVQGGTLILIETGTAGPSSNILGTGTITITPGATFQTQVGGGVSLLTISNPITIGAGAGTATFNGNVGGTADSGAITFATGSTAATIFRIGNTNTTTITDTLSGTVTGTGSIQINSTGASGSPITLSGAQNQTGTITNFGTTAANTSLSTLSGTIGSGISAITQAGTNPFTVSSATIPLSAGLNSFTSTGSGTFTLSGTISGAQNLTLFANSTGAINITGAVNITGTGTNNGVITNSGTGTGAVTISGNIGAGVANVIENSSTSPLYVSGTYAGTISDSTGVTEYFTTAAMAGYSSTTNMTSTISIGSGGILALGYGSTGQFQASDVTGLLANSNGGGTNLYSHLTFAATGASIGLDTTTASATFGNVLANPANTTSFGLVKLGANTLTLGNANTFTGPVAIQNGGLTVSSLNNIASPLASSSLGAPTTIANGTIALGYQTNAVALNYTGPGETTDRIINLTGTTGAVTISQQGSGPLVMNGNMTFTGVGAKTVTFDNNTTSLATYGGTIAGGQVGAAGGQVTLATTGTGTWLLSGTGNTAYELTMAGGTLDIGSHGLNINDTGGATIQNTANTTINATGGGTLTLGGTSATNGPDCGTTAGTTLTINAVVNVVSGYPFEFYDGTSQGTIVLTAQNIFSGGVVLSNGTISVAGIGNTGNAGNLGSGANIYLSGAGGTLKYTGTGETTNKIINLSGTTTAGVLDDSGTGTLTLTSNFATPGAGAKTFTLQGSTAGTGVISGAISDNTAFANTTGVLKQGTGTWTLSGVNTYTGATTVNGGNLVIGAGNTLADTAIAINSTATLSPVAGATAGNTTTAAKGATMTLNAGGTLNLADGAIGAFNVVQNSTFAGAGATFAGGTIVFDLGTSLGSNDYVNVSLNNGTGTGTAAETGSTAIVLNPIGSSLTPGTYDLIKAGSGLVSSNFFLGSPNLTVGGQLYSLVLGLDGTNEAVTITVNNGSPATPGSAYWTGAQNTGSWVTQDGSGNSNFSAGAGGTPNTLALPGPATNVIFTANAATTLSTTLDAAFEINSLAFSGVSTANTAGSTIAAGNGGTLQIDATNANGNTAGNGITISATSGPNTISAPLILGGSQTWTNNSSTNALLVTGVVSDLSPHTTTLSTAGAGTIILANTETYGGTTTIGSGSTLQLGNGGATGGLPAAAAIVDNGTLAFNRGNAVVQGTDFSSAAITGTGGITQSGAATLTLNATNTYSGITSINSGSLSVSAVGNLGASAAANAINFPAGSTGTLILTGASTFNSTVKGTTLTGPGIIEVDGTDAATLGGVIAGAGSLTKTGTGTLSLTGTNTFTGTVNVTGGLIAITGTGASINPVAFLGPKTINLTNGGGIRATGSFVNPVSTSVLAFTIGASGGVFDAQTGSGFQFDDAGQFLGTGNLTIQGAGSGFVYFNNQAYNFTGNVSVNSGELRLGISSGLGTSTGRTLTVASGASVQIESTTNVLPLSLTLNGAGTLTSFGNAGSTDGTVGAALNSIVTGDSVSSNITLASNSTIGATTGTTFTLSGNISGAGGLTTIGGASGSIIVTGAGTYLGNTTISSGILQIGSAGTTGTLPTTGTFTDSGTFAINRTNAVVQGTDFPSAGITGTGGLTQAGTGMTTLNVANSYSGTTTVSAGTLQVTGLGTLGGGTAPLTVSGGTVDLGGTSQTIGALSGAGGTIVNNSGSGISSLTITGASGSYTGVIADNASTPLGTVSVTVTGGQTLGGVNTYSGGTTVNGASSINSFLQLTAAAGAGTGPIALSGGNGLLIGAAVTIGNNISGAGDVENFNGTAGAVTLSGALNYTGQTLFRTAASTVIFNPSANATLPGVIGAALTTAQGYTGVATVSGGLVTKTGANSLTLTAAEQYTGATTVQAGTLALGPGGSLAATAVTVSSGATLSVLPAANSINTTIGSNLALNAGSSFNMSDGFASTATASGTGAISGANLTFDLGSVGGTVTPDKLAITGVATPGAGNVITINGFGTVAPSGTYTIISAGSGLGTAADFTLASPRVIINGTSYGLTLGNSATAETITIGSVGTISAYYNAGAGAGTALNATSGPTTNWSSTSDGLTNLAAQPTGGTDVYFTGANLSTTATISGLGVATTWNSLNFTAGAGAVTVNNSPSFALTLQNGGITDASSNAATFNPPITLAAPQTFSNSGAGLLTLGGAITNGGFLLSTGGSGNITLGGAITGTGGLMITGAGTVTLTGTGSTYSGLTTIANGALVLSAGTLSTGANTTSTLYIGNNNASNGILKIAGATVTLGETNAPSLRIGNSAGAAGDLQVSSGSLTTTSELHIGNNLGVGVYGGATISGGTVTSGSWLLVGSSNDHSVLNQTGGAISVTTNNFDTAAGNTASIGVVNASGGTITASAGGIYAGEYGTGIINVSGTASDTAGTNGVLLGRYAGAVGVVNLMGGTITTPKISLGAGTGTFNFDGGTLVFNTAAGTFTGLTKTYVYGGSTGTNGGKIDIGANAVTIAQSLLAPTGSGIGTPGSAVAGLSVSGGGYIDTPLVVVSGGGGTGATASATINASGTLTGIVVTNPGTGYTSAPAFALLGGGIGNTGSISGTATLAADTSGVLTITATGSDAGILTLSGNSTYSGGTLITGTTNTPQVTVTTATALGSGTVTIRNEGAQSSNLNIGAAVNIANPIVIDTSGKRSGINDTVGSATLSGPISILNYASSGATIFSSNASASTFTITGGITVAAGTAYNQDISFRGSNGAFGLVSTNPINAPNDPVDNNGNANWTISSTGNSWSTTNIYSTGNIILGTSGVIPAATTVQGILNNGVVPTGAIDLNGYNQALLGLGLFARVTNNNATASQPSTLTLNLGSTAYADTAGSINNGTTNSVALVVNGTNGSGSQSIGISTFTGGTTINGGTLSINGNNSANAAMSTGTNTLTNPYAAANALTLAGGTYQLVGRANPTAYSTASAALTSGYTAIALSSAAGLSVGQPVTDTTTAADITAGTYITGISGSTIYLNQATPTTAAAQALAFGTSPITVTTAQTINSVTVSAPSTVDIETSGGAGTTLTFGALAGTGGLTSIGNGTLIIGGTNSTYTGNLTLGGTGTVKMGSTAALGAGNGVTVGAGTTFDLNGNSNTIAGLSDAAGVGGTVTNSGVAATLTLGGSGTTSYAGMITGTNTGLAVSLAGSGSQTLGGANSYGGGTTINTGTLSVVGAAATLGASTGPLAVNNTNTGAGTATILNLSTTLATTVGSLSGTIATPGSGTNSATINNGGQPFTVNQTTAGTYSGIIAGTGSFTLGASSTSTLTLTGGNTYQGGTTILAGTLLANNATGSATGPGTVSVGNGSTAAFLGGGGSIAGPATINAGATLSPSSGGAPATLTMAGAITFKAGSYYQVAIVGGGSGLANAGSAYDSVNNTSGTAVNLGGATLVLVDNVVASGTYDILQNANDAGSGTNPADSFSYPGIGLLASGTQFTGGSNTFTILYNSDPAGDGFGTGNDIVLVSATPEPGTLGLVGLGALGLLARRRRRLVKRN